MLHASDAYNVHLALGTTTCTTATAGVAARVEKPQKSVCDPYHFIITMYPILSSWILYTFLNSYNTRKKSWFLLQWQLWTFFSDLPPEKELPINDDLIYVVGK